MSAQVSLLNLQFGAFPQGYCPASLNEMWAKGVSQIIATPPFSFYGINIGPTAPANTDLPWFNTTVLDWYFYSTITGSWQPVRPVTVTGQVPVGTVLPWMGTIAAAPSWFNVNGAEWQFLQGQAISRAGYPDCFSICGTQYGIGDGATSFNLPDTKDIMIAGASTDDSGTAKTKMSDGITLTKSRAYLNHVHDRNDGLTPPPNQGIGTLGAGAKTKYTDTETKDDASGTAVRVLPPYLSFPFIGRIK